MVTCSIVLELIVDCSVALQCVRSCSDFKPNWYSACFMNVARQVVQKCMAFPGDKQGTVHIFQG